VLIGCGVLGTGILIGAALSGWPAIELVYFASGIALGGVFPMLISLTAQRFPHARGTATGFAVGVGSIGGFVVPWLTGTLGDAAGIVIAFGSLALWPALIALTEITLRKR
jgi:fucose permease